MRRSATFLVVLVLILAGLPAVALSGALPPVYLKYSIMAAPKKLQVDRMPGPQPPRAYSVKFTLVVTNPTGTDYSGTAPSCKTYDVEVVPAGAGGQPAWRWSDGMMFCQAVTPVRIGAGKSWQESATWKFTTADVKDGKYRAIGTFVATNNRSAVVEFEITSVQ